MIIYKDFEFDMAHRLDNYKGLCNNIHGHLYKMSIGLSVNSLNDLGMCVDFKVIKEVINDTIIKYTDHSLWLNKSKSNEKLIKLLTKENMRLLLTPYNPTAEYMALTFWKILSKSLPLFTITLYETPTSKITINSKNYNDMKKGIVEFEFIGDCE